MAYKDKETRRAYDRKYRAEHPEKMREIEKRRIRSPEAKEAQKEYQKEWREKNKERLTKEAAIRQREWREKHPEHKAYQVAYGRSYREKIRTQVFDHYGHSCVCCGESTNEFLTIDHIHNDGKEHRQKVGNYIYKWLIDNNFPEGFQTLCMNCNFAKGIYGTCPHQNK